MELIEGSRHEFLNERENHDRAVSRIAEFLASCPARGEGEQQEE